MTLFASFASPLAARGQGDVELLGRVYDTRPPPGYYELQARDPTAFEFKRAWRARNPRIEMTRFEARDAPGGSGRPLGRITNAPLALGPRGGVVEGAFRFPVVLGYFADDAALPFYSAADVQREFFDGPNSRYKTIPEFYDEISGGRVALGGDTYGWVRSGLTRLETTANVSALGGRVGLFIYELLDAVDDGSIDWGLYDNDGPDGVPNSGDDDGFVDVLVVIHPTFGAECGGAGQNDRVWSHKWSLASAYSVAQPEDRPPGATFATSSVSASGGPIRIDDYTIQPVLSCDGASINEIGVLAHELGHGFGLPDLYCTTTGCSSSGIGRWGLMGSGSWGCNDPNDPSRPCHMGAWSKAMLGWVDVETLAPDADHGVVDLAPVESSGTVLRIDAADGSDEYFLLENRQRLGFDQALAGTGLLVWHIDPDYVAAQWPGNKVNTAPTHQGIWLRQADGRGDLQSERGANGGPAGNRADSGDPFPGSSGNRDFDAGAAPRSVTHEGRGAGVTLTDITEVGTTVRFRAVAGLRDVRIAVPGSPSPGVVLADHQPLPAGGGIVRRAPFESLLLEAAAGESLGPGVRRPFVEWADDPGALRQRVVVTPLLDDPTLTAVYGGEEVEITPDLEGGALGVAPGSLLLTPHSTDLWVQRDEPLTIGAAATAGFDFIGWTGEWAGRPNPFEVTPTGPLTVGARFGLTFVSLATALAVDPQSLDAALRTALDAAGNHDGRYDVGDLRAHLRRGDASPGAAAARVAGGGR